MHLLPCLTRPFRARKWISLVFFRFCHESWAYWSSLCFSIDLDRFDCCQNLLSHSWLSLVNQWRSSRRFRLDERFYIGWKLWSKLARRNNTKRVVLTNQSISLSRNSYNEADGDNFTAYSSGTGHRAMRTVHSYEYRSLRRLSFGNQRAFWQQAP